MLDLLYLLLNHQISIEPSTPTTLYFTATNLSRDSLLIHRVKRKAKSFCKDAGYTKKGQETSSVYFASLREIYFFVPP